MNNYLDSAQRVAFGGVLSEMLGERYGVRDDLNVWAGTLACHILADCTEAGVVVRYVDIPLTDEGGIPDWFIVRGYRAEDGKRPYSVTIDFPTAPYGEIDMEDWRQFSMSWVDMVCRHNGYSTIGGDSDEG